MSELILNSLIMYPKAVLRTSIVILCNIYCIPTYVIWMTMLLPVKRYNIDLYYRIEGIFYHWLLSVVTLWSYTAGYDIVEVGDDISPCRQKEIRTLVIANHQSTADVPLMMACLNVKQDILPNIMWIMDRLFQYTNFGIVSLIHQDFFITSGQKGREASLNQFRKHIEDSFIPRKRNWMILFPEGGFLRKRKEVSQRYAQRNNLPELNNVSLPRVGALKTVFTVLPPRPGNNNLQKPVENGSAVTTPIVQDEEGNINETQTTNTENSQKYLDYVLDITIAYPNGKPLNLPNLINGMAYPCRTHFFYRLYHTSEIPKEEDALTKWLFDRWSEKEKILDYFYRNGNFSHFTSNAPVVVRQDMLRFLIINLFFITSSYAHLQIILMLAGYCKSLYNCTFT